MLDKHTPAYFEVKSLVYVWFRFSSTDYDEEYGVQWGEFQDRDANGFGDTIIFNIKGAKLPIFDDDYRFTSFFIEVNKTVVSEDEIMQVMVNNLNHESIGSYFYPHS